MDPKQIAAMINACLERGFQPPLILCVVGFNGAVSATRFEYARGENTGFESRTLAEYYPERGFGLPAHMLITDASGKGTHMVLNPDGWNFADLN